MGYWNEHYLKGGVSGDGDTNASREWKMDILQKHGLNYNISVVDIGCGDMEFWKDFPLMNYTGVDISRSIIDKNKLRLPKYNFYCSSSSNPLNISADYVTCFDMLFHIMDTTTYIMTLDNLIHYAKQKLFIYTWKKNPFNDFKNRLLIGKPFERNMITDEKFQYYREFDEYSLRYIEPTFRLIDIYTDKRWPYGAMYVYENRSVFNQIV